MSESADTFFVENISALFIKTNAAYTDNTHLLTSISSESKKSSKSGDKKKTARGRKKMLHLHRPQRSLNLMTVTCSRRVKLEVH